MMMPPHTPGIADDDLLFFLFETIDFRKIIGVNYLEVGVVVNVFVS